MKVKNTTTHVLHIGTFSFVPGESEVTSSFADFVNASEFLKKFVKDKLEFEKPKVKEKQKAADQLIEVIAQEADSEKLAEMKAAEEKTPKPRKTVIDVIEARLAEIAV